MSKLAIATTPLLAVFGDGHPCLQRRQYLNQGAWLSRTRVHHGANQYLAWEQRLHDRIPNRRARCDDPLDQSFSDAGRDRLWRD
jgi:hypothetical protein